MESNQNQKYCVGELERAHFNCFPTMGEVKVCGLMVKQKSCFYHMPNSMPIKYAFQWVKGMWFLHVEAVCLSECAAAKAADSVSNGLSLANSTECQNHASTGKGNTKRVPKKRVQRRFHCVKSRVGMTLTPELPKVMNVKEKKRKKKHFMGCMVNRNEDGRIGINRESTDLDVEKSFGAFASRSEDFGHCPVVETPSQSSTEVISVTGIIDRYFSNFNELNQYNSPSTSDLTSRVIENHLGEQSRANSCSNTRVKAMRAKAPRRISRSIQRLRSPKTLKGKIKSCEVGRRLLMASNSLGVSSISICRYKHERSLKLGSPIRNLVFEISDRED